MVEKIKGYVISKRFLYTLCFIALMFIDWTRGSQVGSTWAWTINMTGVVMAVILFSAYSPREFLKPVYIIYSIIGVAALPAAYYWWLHNQTVIYRHQLLTAVLNVWLLGIFVIKLFLDVVVYKGKKLQFYKIEVLAAVMLLWMFFSVNEDIWPSWYLIMFGLLYHTEYRKEDMEELKEGMLSGIILSFFLLQGMAFAFRPYDTIRYKGIYANSNMNALFYGVVWIAFILKLYDIRKKKQEKWKEILCFFFAGIMMAFVFITGCRTALLAMIVTGFFYAIFADFRGLGDKANKFIRKLTLYIFIVCFSVPVVYMSVRYLPPVLHHPVWYEGEYNVKRVHSFDSWDSEKYVSWDDCCNMMVGRIKPIIKMFFGEEQVGLITIQAAEPGAENDKAQYVNGSIQIRLRFWDFYIRNGNLKGHLRAEGHELPDFPRQYIWHTQNVFVQFWYYYGIPSAVLFMIVVIVLVVVSIKKILKDQEEVLICLLYFIFWIMYGLAEAVWYPGQIILFLAFLTTKFLRETEERYR